MSINLRKYIKSTNIVNFCKTKCEYMAEEKWMWDKDESNNNIIESIQLCRYQEECETEKKEIK